MGFEEGKRKKAGWLDLVSTWLGSRRRKVGHRMETLDRSAQLLEVFSLPTKRNADKPSSRRSAVSGPQQGGETLVSGFNVSFPWASHQRRDGGGFNAPSAVFFGREWQFPRWTPAVWLDCGLVDVRIGKQIVCGRHVAVGNAQARRKPAAKAVGFPAAGFAPCFFVVGLSEKQTGGLSSINVGRILHPKALKSLVARGTIPAIGHSNGAFGRNPVACRARTLCGAPSVPEVNKPFPFMTGLMRICRHRKNRSQGGRFGKAVVTPACAARHRGAGPDPVGAQLPPRPTRLTGALDRLAGPDMIVNPADSLRLCRSRVFFLKDERDLAFTIHGEAAGCWRNGGPARPGSCRLFHSRPTMCSTGQGCR